MKTMITKLITTFCVILSCTLNAQNNCNETLSLFAENVKTKRFAEASSQLKFLRKNCATLNYVIYARGEKVLVHELKQATDKKQAALALIQLYKDRLQYFPDKTKKGKYLPKIGALMIKYKIGTISEQYQWFDDAFNSDKKHFTNPLNLYFYFELYYKMYQSKTNGISLENLIEKYKVIKDKLAFEKTQKPKNSDAIDKLTNNMNVFIEKEATCETLIPMFRKKFQENAKNIDWLRKAAGQLDAKKCDDDALFIEMVETIDAVEPSANSKLYLYKIHSRKGNTEKANTYLNQYIALETDINKKGKFLNKLGKDAEKLGNKSKAHSYYVKASKIAPNTGRTYLNLAKLYESSANACGNDEFTKKAIYWKAAEMARKAAKVDPSVKAEANKWIKRYMSLAPNKEAIFNKGFKGGEKIILKCWVGGHVIVPNL
ncbi:tetratricopeptide repeat protein [Kordia sp.]|uniref:tetratricopeptide repeat protein n=1 Tax=Kordia sp. TaxID=1965332 RepID=UPI003B58FF32